MRAVAFRQHGDEQVLELLELPEPAVGARDVLVRVKAVALNHLDRWVRQGWPGLKLSLPHVLGSDIAGVVERVGAEVKDVEPGTEVLVNPGLSCGHCERCLLGEDNLCRHYRIIGEHARAATRSTCPCPGRTCCPSPGADVSPRPPACPSPTSPRGRCWCGARR
jgi:NADPH:quinone reductase-like Zn-dependent oxidoreductase